MQSHTYFMQTLPRDRHKHFYARHTYPGNFKYRTDEFFASTDFQGIVGETF